MKNLNQHKRKTSITKPMKQTTVNLEASQKQFIYDNELNLSSIVRDSIESMPEYQTYLKKVRK